ncbi:MAG: translation elongation factor Ts [Candidatus Limnocylindria bacterium]
MDTKPLVSPADIKALREQTGAGVMDCKRALEASGGDFEAAAAFLRQKGLATAREKADRVAREGVIASYIHHGSRLGVLLELNCETDFVARTDDFQQLARELAIQVAGFEPKWIDRVDVPAELVAAQRERLQAESVTRGESSETAAEYVDRQLDHWFESVCLLEMAYRGTDRKVRDLITEKISVMGENIRVARFVRMAVGETAADPDREALRPGA